MTNIVNGRQTEQNKNFHPSLFLFPFSYYLTCKEKIKCPKMYVNIHAQIIVSSMILLKPLICIIIHYKFTCWTKTRTFSNFTLSLVQL